jgi:tetratricopeptide (TPR) repeat protein
VVEGSSTDDVVASIRAKISGAKNVPRTALYGLLRDYGLRTTVTMPVRLVTPDGIEYDAGKQQASQTGANKPISKQAGANIKKSQSLWLFTYFPTLSLFHLAMQNISFPDLSDSLIACLLTYFLACASHVKEDGSTEPVELVVSAVGPPNVFISHAWEGDFNDTVIRDFSVGVSYSFCYSLIFPTPTCSISSPRLFSTPSQSSASSTSTSSSKVAATVAWCKSSKLDPAAVYVWLDCWSLDQWSEVTGAVVEAGAIAPAVTEASVAEACVYAIRACGNTVCVGSPGFVTPFCLERLWCCVEVYVSVRVGAKCHFALPPSQQATFDQLVYQDLPKLLAKVTRGVDVRSAKTTSQQDKAMLFKWLKGGHKQWGIESCSDLRVVDRAIGSVLRSFLAQAARRIIETRGVGGVRVEELIANGKSKKYRERGEEEEGDQEEEGTEGAASSSSGGGGGGKIGDEEKAAKKEAALEDKRQLPIMKGYALLLEEHGRCGVGHGRGWSFKMSVIWYLKVLRLLERSSNKSNLKGGRTTVALLHVACLLKLQGKREEAITKYQRVALVLQDVLAKKESSGSGLARSLLGAVRCDIAVLLRDIGRFDDSIAEFKQGRRELNGQAVLSSGSGGLGGRYGMEGGVGNPFEMLKESTVVLDLVARGGDEGLLFESLMGMASVRVLQGQHEAALVLFEEALTEQETVLGTGHPSTINTVACISSLRKRLMVGGMSSLMSRNSGDDTLNTTLSHLEMTLRVYEVVFGVAHPHTVSVVLQVASMMQRLNRPKDALRCYARALAEYAADEAKVAEEIDARQRFLEDGTFQGVISNEKSEVRGGYLHPFGTDSGAGGTGVTDSGGGGNGDDDNASVASGFSIASSSSSAAGTHYDVFALHAARDTGGQYSPLDTAACVNNMVRKERGRKEKYRLLTGDEKECFAQAALLFLLSLDLVCCFFFCGC